MTDSLQKDRVASAELFIKVGAVLRANILPHAQELQRCDQKKQNIYSKSHDREINRG